MTEAKKDDHRKKDNLYKKSKFQEMTESEKDDHRDNENDYRKRKFQQMAKL